jgi:hypothetical protein
VLEPRTTRHTARATPLSRAPWSSLTPPSKASRVDCALTIPRPFARLIQSVAALRQSSHENSVASTDVLRGQAFRITPA